jgi:hypothetical protein
LQGVTSFQGPNCKTRVCLWIWKTFPGPRSKTDS